MLNLLRQSFIPGKLYPTLKWGFAILIAILATLKHPLMGPAVGDEPYYIDEVLYFEKYGFIQALSQGTSFFYTLTVFIFSKVFATSYLVAGRLLNIIFLGVCMAILPLILRKFKHINENIILLSCISFTWIYKDLLWLCLPDLISIAFSMIGILSLLNSSNNRSTIIAAIATFLAFTYKPVALFFIPALILLILAWGDNKKRLQTAVVFFSAFIICFAAYHMPGYHKYGSIMLENKDHTYDGITRVPRTTTWGHRNFYYLIYSGKDNKWSVTLEEVDSFKNAHPGALDYTFSSYVKKHPNLYLKNLGSKLFLTSHYHTQNTFFYSKWTIINKWINNYTVIYIISGLIFLGMCIAERKFITDNKLLFAIAVSYYVFLSLYCCVTLEDNWLVLPIAFFALPIARFIDRRMNAYLILSLQLSFIIYEYAPLL